MLVEWSNHVVPWCSPTFEDKWVAGCNFMGNFRLSLQTMDRDLIRKVATTVRVKSEQISLPFKALFYEGTWG
jgi:hypothetical protein